VGPEIRSPGFDKELFLQAWLCLLTRKFSCPNGSSFVPGVDFFNHSASPGAGGDWDDSQEAVVVRARRPHSEGEEVKICYGELSNPLLWRTYGFTLPPSEEPSWTCTLKESDLVELCYEGGPAGPDLAEDFAQLPNIHLDAGLVTDTLAAALEACAVSGGDAARLLRELCRRRSSLLDADPSLAPFLSSLRGACARAEDRAEEGGGGGGDSTGGAASSSATPAGEEAASWWRSALAASFSSSSSGRNSSPAEEAAVRVKMSEYLCLAAHLEALDVAMGGGPPEGQRLERALGLRQDLLALRSAGLLLLGG